MPASEKVKNSMAAAPKDARKKDSGAEQIRNAEEFAHYVHAVSIPMKVVMAAIVVFFAGLIAFCVFGRVPVTIDVAAVVDDTGACVCYVKVDDRDGIEPGDTVELGGGTYEVKAISTESTCVDETIYEYARQVGDLSVGDYVYLVTLDADVPLGVYSATLTKDYLQPLAVLLSI